MIPKMPSDVETVAVLGLGVMGGSLVQALARHAPETRRVGWSPSLGERSAALESGALTDAPSAWEDAVLEADLVVLAMPMEACLHVLADLEGLTRPTATLTDVASLKVPVRKIATQSGVARRWVGSHPMAGSEGTGFTQARAGLFVGATVWMTDAGAEASHVERVEALWRLLGGNPRTVEDDVHDRSMALVSHLPQIVANALGAELARREVPSHALGPGGRDMTRLAASPPSMWMDLFRHAPAELADGLRGVSAILDRTALALESGHMDELERLMKESRVWRSES